MLVEYLYTKKKFWESLEILAWDRMKFVSWNTAGSVRENCEGQDRSHEPKITKSVFALFYYNIYLHIGLPKIFLKNIGNIQTKQFRVLTEKQSRILKIF